MKTSQLAQVFELKYGLRAEAVASPAEILVRIKSAIKQNYLMWVMGKYPALRSLAMLNEPYAKKLFAIYQNLFDNIDDFSPVQLFNRVNKILGLIAEMKSNPKEYRESIHDIVEISRESDRNRREKIKSGFETNLTNISRGLEPIAKELRAFVPDTELAGGIVEPQRQELSKDKLLEFKRSPLAHQYGLDNIEVLTQALMDPEIKNRITTVINAVSRGRHVTDPRLLQEIQHIKEWLDSKKTNLSALERIPENPASVFSLLEEKEEENK